MNESTVPNMETITIHGSKIWIYATVDDRDFKVHEDKDGDLEIRERIVGDAWGERSEPGFDTLAEAILNHHLND